MEDTTAKKEEEFRPLKEDVEIQQLRNKHEFDQGPVGRWRDGMFDCWGLGFFHKMWCFAFVCPALVLGQLMTRFNLDWLGNIRTGNSSSNTAFRFLFLVELALQITELLSLDLMVLLNKDWVADFLASHLGVGKTKRYVDAAMSGLYARVLFDLAYLVYVAGLFVRTNMFNNLPRSLKFPLAAMFIREMFVVATILIPSVVASTGDSAEVEAYGSIQPSSMYTPSCTDNSCGGGFCGLVLAPVIFFIEDLWFWIELAFLVIIGVRVRVVIRRKYAIPDRFEDCMMIVPCCGILQMARHSIDHKKTPYHAGTEDGLPVPDYTL